MKNFKNSNNYVTNQIAQNKIELSKAENITKEIKQNIAMNLYDDWLVLM